MCRPHLTSGIKSYADHCLVVAKVR